MTTKRMIFVIGAVAVLVVAVTAFVLTRPRQSGHGFAFFLYDGSDTFIAEMINCIAASIPEGVSFEVFDAGNSQSVQNR